MNGRETKYVYDGANILLELDSNGAVQARYTHGPGTDHPLIMERGGQSYRVCRFELPDGRRARLRNARTQEVQEELVRLVVELVVLKRSWGPGKCIKGARTGHR